MSGHDAEVLRPGRQAQGLYSLPESIPGEKHGRQMRIDTKLFRPGQTFVWTFSGPANGGGGSTTTSLMEGPVSSCEPVPAPVQKEIKAEFRTATTKGGSLEGFRVDEKTVGEVLQELKNAKGVIRLLVTDRRYDKNPVYGGPRDAIIIE